ncbi:predicted protein [Histoplasma capsulatum H143]|uniref:Uncharacterized protein n=1 Tax=Ajellomyces capsulatus (strain H143) TaxID=544712 RepID=C6H5I2_AJECH|nr:predicted protein [Histoplasma capsulatum H143]
MASGIRYSPARLLGYCKRGTKRVQSAGAATAAINKDVLQRTRSLRPAVTPPYIPRYSIYLTILRAYRPLPDFAKLNSSILLASPLSSPLRVPSAQQFLASSFAPYRIDRIPNPSSPSNLSFYRSLLIDVPSGPTVSSVLLAILPPCHIALLVVPHPRSFLRHSPSIVSLTAPLLSPSSRRPGNGHPAFVPRPPFKCASESSVLRLQG